MTNSEGADRKLWIVGPFFVLALSSVLRLWGLSDRSIWFDEASAWACVDQFRVSGIIKSCQQNVHPPFFYLILKCWVGFFGDSLTSIRALPALFGVLTVAGVMQLASLVTPSNADRWLSSILAGLTCGLSAFQILWSTQCRMYSIGTFLTVFSTVQVAGWCQAEPKSSNRRYHLTLYWLLATALVYTHNYGLFVIVSHAVFVAAVGGDQQDSVSGRFRRTASLVLPVAIAYLPWAKVLLKQTNRVRADYWVPPLNIDSLPRAWHQVLFPADPEVPATLVAWLAGVVLVGVCGYVARRVRPAALCASLAIVPSVAALLVSLVVAPILVPRYLIFAHLGFCVCVGVGIGTVASRLIRVCASLALVGFSVIGSWHFGATLDAVNRPGLRRVASEILDRRRSADLVVAATPSIYHALVFHLSEDSSGRESVLLLSDSRELSHYNGGPVVSPTVVRTPESLDNGRATRVWLVDTTGFYGFFPHHKLSGNWQRDSKLEITEREVFTFQGDVFVSTWFRNAMREK